MKKKRFSETEIVGILAEADKGGKTIAELCKIQGISEQTEMLPKNRTRR